MKKTALLLCSYCCMACNPFSPLADATVIGHESMYTSVSNPKANIKSLTFGDFEFARNRKELKKNRWQSKGL